MSQCLAFLREEQAATAVEYAVMLGLILVAVVTAVSGVGLSTLGLLNNSQTQMVTHGLGN